jgi:citrate lyase beta subunit
VANVESNQSESIDHKEKLAGFPKESLIDEVIKTWDALAQSEASMNDMSVEIGRLEVEIAKMKAIDGVSLTKVEMSKRIEELEAQLQSHEEGSTNNTQDVLETKIEVLLAALLDLEREVSSIGDVKDGRELD